MNFHQYKAKKKKKAINAGAGLCRPRHKNHDLLLLLCRVVPVSFAETAAIFESLGVFEHLF